MAEVEQQILRVTKAHWEPVVKPGDGAHINLDLLRQIVQDTKDLEGDVILRVKTNGTPIVSEIWIDDKREHSP